MYEERAQVWILHFFPCVFSLSVACQFGLKLCVLSVHISICIHDHVYVCVCPSVKNGILLGVYWIAQRATLRQKEWGLLYFFAQENKLTKFFRGIMLCTPIDPKHSVLQKYLVKQTSMLFSTFMACICHIKPLLMWSPCPAYSYSNTCTYTHIAFWVRDMKEYII